MNVIGISAHYHESACCLLQDGRLVAAAEEERFTRTKHDKRLPVQAFRYCLEAGGLGIGDVDFVAYYESPVKKLGRQLWAQPARGFAPPDLARPEREIRELLGYEGKVEFLEHHQSHAASAFYFSGFEQAAVLVADGVGEWATTSYWTAGRGGLDLLEEVEFPHSLGLFYSAITSFLGFAVNDGEYKVMGLAPYGEPRFQGVLREVVRTGPGGQYELDLSCFDFVHGERMYSERLAERLGGPPRGGHEPISAFHHDVARSAQAMLEEILLEKVSWLHEQTGLPDLALAGGVALNCVANGRIRREGPFRDLFVQPAAGDAGGALGAAALVSERATGGRPAPSPLSHVYFGPGFASAGVAEDLEACGVSALDFRGREVHLVEAAAERLAAGQVLGWFHGRMELGPRALGARSILADPRDPGMRDRLNAAVKKREGFRPFAPSVLLAEAARHFDLDHPSPFMLETCAVRSPLDLPAITHVDGSARVQTVDPMAAPRFAALLAAFARRTGCPLLVNTSFNVKDEPIVCSPLDALLCFVDAGLDAVVLEDFLVERAAVSASLQDAVRARRALARRESALSTVLYTFV